MIIGFWVMMNILPWCAYFGYTDVAMTSVPTFWGYMLIIFLISALTAKCTIKVWYAEVFFYGVKPISDYLLNL